MSDFWDGVEVIHTYTRARAIADGVLIDAGQMAREAGFTFPVALTVAAHADAVSWTEDDDVNKGGFTGQDPRGRLWDVLTLAGHAARNPANAGKQLVRFNVLRVPREGREVRPTTCELVMHVGPGDQGEGVLTIMLPGED